MSEIMPCKICASKVELFSRACLLGKYDVEYYRCSSCGFICTEEPYWLEEAYFEAIKRSDVGHIQRNMRLAKITKAVIMSFFNGNSRFLDYGSGYGLLARIMRDSGFDFNCFDKHCVNLFTPDFVANPVGKDEYELVTAFEVFEHLVDPIQEISEMLSFSSSILFTTELLPTNTPKPKDWSYYGLEHGQHISFFTLKSLEVIADKFSLNLSSDGKKRHLLTPKKISPIVFRVVSLYNVAVLLSPLFHRRSLTAADYKLIVGKALK
jgi:Methyltransferase domain